MSDIQPLTKVKSSVQIEGFHSIYYFEFDKYHSHPPETHDFWEMVYVDMGSIIAVAENESIPLSRGQVIFHPPKELHAHISNMKDSNNLLVVSFSCDSPAMDFFKKNRVFDLDNTSKTLLSLFTDEAKNALTQIPNRFKDRFPLDFANESFGSSQLMKYHFTEFLIKLIRKGTAAESKKNGAAEALRPDKENAARRIAEYLRENVYNQIVLDDLCKRFYLQKSQICVIFREYSGKSPMQYYYELKISEAKRLLRDGVSVSEISEKLNYSCIHSFSSAFKRSVGFSPTDYKKSVSSFLE